VDTGERGSDQWLCNALKRLLLASGRWKHVVESEGAGALAASVHGQESIAIYNQPERTDAKRRVCARHPGAHPTAHRNRHLDGCATYGGVPHSRSINNMAPMMAYIFPYCSGLNRPTCHCHVHVPG
jgi:hypothetical protein